MPEATQNAAILIATSFQALNRAKPGDTLTLLCNCTRVVLFAGFFIEENLDFIIKERNVESDMRRYLKVRGNQHLGLLDKFAWYFNRYITKDKVDSGEKLHTSKIEGKLIKKFPGFNRIYRIRNDLSHGKINRRLTLRETKKLRLQAKSVVDDLLKIASSNRCQIPRDITYYMATADYDERLSED